MFGQLEERHAELADANQTLFFRGRNLANPMRPHPVTRGTTRSPSGQPSRDMAWIARAARSQRSAYDAGEEAEPIVGLGRRDLEVL